MADVTDEMRAAFVVAQDREQASLDRSGHLYDPHLPTDAGLRAVLRLLSSQPVNQRHVVEELLANIKRTCIRGRNVADMKVEKNFVATCDHIENLTDQAIAALTGASK